VTVEAITLGMGALAERDERSLFTGLIVPEEPAQEERSNETVCGSLDQPALRLPRDSPRDGSVRAIAVSPPGS
jgi:hypothetical protein